MSRAVMQQALDVLEAIGGEWGFISKSTVPKRIEVIAALRAELDHIPDAGKMVGPEPVHHAVIAGALFDFMGWLTSRKERLALSSADEASPAVDAIRDFAKMRGLSLDDAKVQGWDTTRPAQLNDFNPDWDAMAVMVEEQQRMAKRIAELEALLERQTARIVNLQDEIRNLTGEE